MYIQILVAVLCATSLVGLSYLLRSYRLQVRNWRPFLSAFGEASGFIDDERKQGKPCALVLNGAMLGDGTKQMDRFSLARPRVLLHPYGIAFFVSPDPFAMFTPVLVHFARVKSFGRVRDDAGEWIEIEFQSGGIHAWAHLPTSLAKDLRAHGIAEGIPAYRLHILDPAEDWSPQSHASIYQRLLKCSPWTAEKLKEVEHRDPLDVVTDLEALAKALDDEPVGRADSYARRLQTDPSTSYFLLRMLDECCRTGPEVYRKQVQQLLVFARARLDAAMRPNAYLLAPIE
jgi:hypothetical protein